MRPDRRVVLEGEVFVFIVVSFLVSQSKISRQESRNKCDQRKGECRSHGQETVSNGLAFRMAIGAFHAFDAPIPPILRRVQVMIEDRIQKTRMSVLHKMHNNNNNRISLMVNDFLTATE